MNRYEFLKSLGVSGAALMAVLASCQRDEIIQPDGPVDFNLDLDDPANFVLKHKGGYIIANGVVVARSNYGKLVAATQTCSHERNKQVIFHDDEFVCQVHGARFSLKGDGLNNYGSKGLRIFKVDQMGTIIRVYS